MSSPSDPCSTQPVEKYGGTVAIGLNSKTECYNTSSSSKKTTTTSSTTTTTSSGSIYNSPLSYNVPKTSLLPVKPVPLLLSFDKCQKEDIKGDVDQQYEEVKKLYLFAQKVDFDYVKERLFKLICQEINAANPPHDPTDPSEPSVTFGDDGETTLTVEYLEKVAQYDQDEQSQTLDEFGLDSITGFKLGKVIADEFHIPASTMGPHLFLNDPHLYGVVNTILRLVKSNALQVQNEYEEKFNQVFSTTQKPSKDTVKVTKNDTNTSKVPQNVPNQSHPSALCPNSFYSSDQFNLPYDKTDTHDKTAAFVFRGSDELDRIPYILGLGTSTPHIASPQDLVIEAMLVPMKMDDKSNERFRKIGAHSGVGTRYSVLNNLGQIFWGKEGVNLDNDEFIDVRQQVFKRESVKLSIQSAADAVRDWIGEKVYLNDEERDEERMKKYKECERLHQEYEKTAKKTYTDESRIVHALEEGGDTVSPIDSELKTQKEKAEKLKNVRSFAEGDSHLVETTSGNKEEDIKILQLGTQMASKLDRTITHIVAITCTGVIVPGLEFHIMKALGLPSTTQRLPITFAGCFGAISGLRIASSLANENPLHRVLVVCTELCTLHMQLSDKIDNLVGSALFADGSGAFIVGCAPTPQETPIYSIDSLSSYVIPNTVQQMAWEATKSGQVIGLAKEIASEIFGVIGDVVDDLLQYTPDPKHPQHRISPGDCNLAIHPGGPLIINTIQGGFGLPPIDDSSKVDRLHPVAETWKILHEYGNMSSATLVYVLDRLRLQKEKNNKPTPTLAFGPGLSVEASLLHRLDANPGDKKMGIKTKK